MVDDIAHVLLSQSIAHGSSTLFWRLTPALDETLQASRFGTFKAVGVAALSLMALALLVTSFHSDSLQPEVSSVPLIFSRIQMSSYPVFLTLIFRFRLWLPDRFDRGGPQAALDVTGQPSL